MKYKKIILLVSLIIAGGNLLFAQIPNPDNVVIPKTADNLKNPFANQASVMKSGYKIYTKFCWVCHGDAGKGDGPSVPTLTVTPANLSEPTIKELSDGALFWWISNGGNGMQPFKDAMSKEQIWMVVNYVRKLQGNPVRE